MSIRVSKLYKEIGKQIVLNNISFNIDAGEVVGFLGPNGAGKTTTMRILTGALSYKSGSVQICNLEVAENRLPISKMIGYLPENNPLYHEMYVREYLDFVARCYKIKVGRQQKVEEIIERVGLPTEANKKIHQLSKGYKQRVGLAQALIHNPQVLILDEPTTGLDPIQLDDIRSLIKDIGKEKTVLLSTHIMQEVEAVCSRALIINKGEIVGDIDLKSKGDIIDNELKKEDKSLEEIFKSLAKT
ncbi:MAG: multidrug ABC transporter ATP-binding protein [Bacteroidales bacterium 36-12]|nr:MAG: multidrug ABC transporter ATP-binding protein [Bacteroidales bacterium 36-12]